METTADLYRMTRALDFSRSRLVTCWYEDPGGVGNRVVRILNDQLGARSFCDIEPPGFFPLAGVPMQDNVARFPQSRFWGEPTRGLVTFLSNEPPHAKQAFVATLLDVAQHYCHVEELIVISGQFTAGDYRAPRRCYAVFNQPNTKKQWRRYALEEPTYEDTPSLSIYLLWEAGNREIPGVRIRVDVPFYLSRSGDPRAVEAVLQPLSDHLEIDLDLTDLDQWKETQHRKLDELRSRES
ncbi:MAG: PAC2 family protein, partial [Candidatus Zixiibacteriota bacterium]